MNTDCVRCKCNDTDCVRCKCNDTDCVRCKYNKMREELKCMMDKLLEKIKDTLMDLDPPSKCLSTDIDYIKSRVKKTKSFVKKASKINSDNSLKYESPFDEIQDMIGFRIILLYSDRIREVRSLLEEAFKIVEDKKRGLQGSEFGYDAHHIISLVPINLRKYCPSLQFFEIQITTIFQHAWSATTHQLLYKDEGTISNEDIRTFAFVAAQAWNADKSIDNFRKDSG